MPVVMLYESFSVFIPLRPNESRLVARHNLFYTLPSSSSSTFFVKQLCYLIVLFRKNSIQKFSISFVIIPVEATHTVYKTYMFDVGE